MDQQRQMSSSPENEAYGPMFLNPGLCTEGELADIVARVRDNAEKRVAYVSDSLGYEARTRVYYDGVDFIKVVYEPVSPGPSVIPEHKVDKWAQRTDVPQAARAHAAAEREKETSSGIRDEMSSQDEESEDEEPIYYVTRSRIRGFLAEECDWNMQAETGIFMGLRVHIPVSADDEDDFYENVPEYYRSVAIYDTRYFFNSKGARNFLLDISRQVDTQAVKDHGPDEKEDNADGSSDPLCQKAISNFRDLQLCEQCVELYRYHFLHQQFHEKPGKYGVLIQAIGHIMPDAKCGMCRFLSSLRSADSTTSEYYLYAFSGFAVLFGESIEQYQSHLTDMDMSKLERYMKEHPIPLFLLSSKFRGRLKEYRKYLQAIMANRRVPVKDTLFYAVLPDATRAPRTSKILSRLGSQGFFTTSVMSPEPELGEKLISKRLDKHAVDLESIRKWIQSCSVAGCLTERARVKAKVPLYLLCCDTRKVTRGSFQMSYVALSYVWGATVASFQPRTRNPPYTIPDSLPATIGDAIVIAKELGFKYIWVDMYCIASDPKYRHHQIARMDLVYRYARVTIVAAAGLDAGFGLPGVGSKGRRGQALIRPGLSEWIGVCPGWRSILGDSVYRTRAWTYQEEFFSSHKLIFTDYQVFYHCPRGVRYESLEMPEPWFEGITNPNALSTDLNDKFLRRFSGVGVVDETDTTGIMLGRKPLTLQIFEQHIYQYTKRKLTMSSDSLDAIKSILDRFSNEQHPIYHMNGIPVQREHESAWDVLSKHFPKTKGEYDILYGLAWTHGADQRAVSRRLEFPTWSWAGWEGAVTWAIEATTEGNFESVLKDTKIYYLDQGSKLPAGSWRNSSARPAPRELVVSTDLYGVQLVPASRTHQESKEIFVWNEKTTIPGTERSVVAGAGSVAHITVPKEGQSIDVNQPWAFRLGQNLNAETDYLLLINFSGIGSDGMFCASRIGITEVSHKWLRLSKHKRTSFVLK